MCFSTPGRSIGTRTRPTSTRPGVPAPSAVAKEGLKPMHALVITFRSAVSREQLQEDFTRAAEALRDGAARGLVSKTWMYDGSGLCSFLLFEERGDADDYLSGFIADAIMANPIFSDIRVERYDVNEALSRITGGLGAMAVGARS